MGFFNSPKTFNRNDNKINNQISSRQNDDITSNNNIYSEIFKDKESPKKFDKSKIKVMKK